MTQFFRNDRSSLVDQAIRAAVATSRNQNLARLQSDDPVKVVVSRHWRPEFGKVAVISGGGSGHEPAHLGFVGKGMLTAAVCGELFASPSVDAVYDAITAVTGPAGCLLVVKNYTGDRLNFGLAAERARFDGLKVEMVIVEDDIALPHDVSPRGIAGTLFVHKVAGFVADQGASLFRVQRAAQHACSRMASIGVAMESCTLPSDAPKEERIPNGSIELGLGIHGEPGASQMEFGSSEEVVKVMLSRLEQALTTSPQDAHQDERYALLFNNLGGMSPIEMSVVLHDLIQHPLMQKVQFLLGPGSFMTSLDMKGFSLSLLKLDDSLRSALRAPVRVDAWPHVLEQESASPAFWSLEFPRYVPKGGTRSLGSSSGDADELDGSSRKETQLGYSLQTLDHPVGKAIQKVVEVLVASEEELNRMDREVGDGDTGTTFATAAKEIERARRSGDLFGPTTTLFLQLASLLSRRMGGSSGVLLAILFTTAGTSLSEAGGEEAGLPLQRGADALLEGLARMQEYGGAKPGDRTMIDALLPGLRVVSRGGTLEEAAEAAAKGAESTGKMTKAGVGRSSYIAAEHLEGRLDPGAEAVARIFEAIKRWDE